MIRTLASALLILTAGISPPPTNAATLNLKNMIGKIVDGGTYTKVIVDNCRDCTIRNVTVLPPPPASINDQAVRIVNSPGITFERSTVTGQAATTGVPPTAPGPAKLVLGLWGGEGIHIERSPGATIRLNVVTRFHQGLALGKQDDLTISGNMIADMRTSGIVGTPGNNLHIVGNGIGASHPWRWGQTPAGDHGDKIHLWSGGGSVTGLTITDNVIKDGNGVAILGIFIQRCAGKVCGSFDQAIIERNLIMIGQTLAMMLTGVNGSVSDNELVPLSTKKPATIYSGLGNSGVWRGNHGGLGVTFDRRLTAAQKALVKVLP